MIDPGRLNHSVVIESPGTPAPDGDGGFSNTWSAITPSPIFGAFYSATARAMDRLGGTTAIESVATHIFETHYYAGLTTLMRLRIDTRVFAVRGVQNVDEADEMTRLFIEEVEGYVTPPVNESFIQVDWFQ